MRHPLWRAAVRYGLLGLALVACSGADDKVDESDASDVDTDTDPDTTDTDTTETADTAVAPFMSTSCVESADNLLRYTCSVQVSPPHPVEITFSKSDGTGVERVHRSDGTTDTTVTLYFLAQQTDYTWTARVPDGTLPEVTGQFTTGVLPPELQVVPTITGTSSTPMLGMSSPCSSTPGAAIMDSTGELLWYQLFTSSGYVDGMSFTEDGTVLGLVGAEITEYALDGTELMRLSQVKDFTSRIHHDVMRKGGLTYVLFQEVRTMLNGDFLIDGFYVFDELGTQVGEWHLADHHEPLGGAPTPLGVDYSHANSIWIDDDADIYVSFRHLSAVVKIDGDLTSPDFGQILWRLSGDPANGALGTDFTLTASAGASQTFEMQHNVHRLPDGRMAMFDNRKTFLERSRVLHLVLDETAMTADIAEVYEMPLHCPFQGGAWHTPAGNPIGTCAPNQLGLEFEATTYDAPAYTIEVTCGDGTGNYVPRFVPLDW